eukprot:CAMPEP_0172919402 /NCGR_PEP_ID=MMETSP1075-20121228/202068_1 /TAXON_ID=2916 /ORGANISM="Ceratium fusus, Strain PA161109" /LENGTH=404 /DNA_ID=CAMNT_0013779243 /DNA_START=54 /DNA_END=1265 /DNA_ORIENTATION=-
MAQYAVEEGSSAIVVGRPHLEAADDERPMQAARRRQHLSGEPGDTPPETDDNKVLCEDRIRHAILSVRLRRGYYLYLFVCFALSAVLCVSNITRAVKLRRTGGKLVAFRTSWLDVIAEAMVASAMCIETFSTLWLRGRDAFFKDCWCILDMSVLLLTLLDLFIRLVLWALPFAAEMAVDLSVVTLRFILQPCRLLAAASMVRRVKQMQEMTVDIEFEALTHEIPGPDLQNSRILTKALQAAIAAELPTWCKYQDWTLGYAPHTHGLSYRTFLRSQVGANIILVREAGGALLGGFVPEPWQRCAEGHSYYGGGDCFVFTSSFAKESSKEHHFLELEEENKMHPAGDTTKAPIPNLGNKLDFFHVQGGSGEVVIQVDDVSLTLGCALCIRADLASGTSAPSSVFGS